jgi:hypothetical protein
VVGVITALQAGKLSPGILFYREYEISDLFKDIENKSMILA